MVPSRDTAGRSFPVDHSIKAIAYWHGPDRIHKMAMAFEMGCRIHGIRCQVKHVSKYTPDHADLVWLYGLGEALPVYKAHEGAVRCVGDKGYFAGYPMPKYQRVSVNAQQPDAHLQRRPHPSDRFSELKIEVTPAETRGDYVLICGMGPKQCKLQGLSYGQWETETYQKVRAVTDRPILIREKPKNAHIPCAPRSTHASTAEAIRGAWAVVCLTGNIGVDCILHGVPVIAREGPGSVYYKATLADIETIKPLTTEQRKSALSDVAYWNWRRDEFTKGAFISHLKDEGLL